MDVELLNMIAGASVNGYYDPSLGLVVVWFHNNDNRADIVSYLLKDMTWDVRKVITEESTLTENKEIVEIHHELIDIFDANSKFDNTIRSLLKQMTDQIDENSKSLDELASMRIILENNTYNSVEIE